MKIGFEATMFTWILTNYSLLRCNNLAFIDCMIKAHWARIQNTPGQIEYYTLHTDKLFLNTIRLAFIDCMVRLFDELYDYWSKTLGKEFHTPAQIVNLFYPIMNKLDREDASKMVKIPFFPYQERQGEKGTQNTWYLWFISKLNFLRFWIG